MGAGRAIPQLLALHRLPCSEKPRLRQLQAERRLLQPAVLVAVPHKLAQALLVLQLLAMHRLRCSEKPLLR